MIPKISVIVPVYNAEKWLHCCIDSVLAQTYTDFELLLVDDGSTDRSGKICDEYESIDSRVKVFHKKNGGVSSARNFGIINCIGDSLTFIDSDDWVTNEYLENIVGHEKYDLVISYYKAVGWPEWESRPYQECCYNTESINEFFDKYLISCNTVWCKLFKRDILIKHNILFKPFLNYGEDTVFVLEYMKYINTIYCSSKSNYIYNCLNSGGLSSTFQIDKTINLIDLMANEIDELGTIFNWYCQKTKNEILRLSCNRIFKLFNYNQPNAYYKLKSICNNKNIKNVINDKSLSKSRKKALFDMLIRLNAYKLIIYLMKIKAKLNG